MEKKLPLLLTLECSRISLTPPLSRTVTHVPAEVLSSTPWDNIRLGPQQVKQSVIQLPHCTPRPANTTQVCGRSDCNNLVKVNKKLQHFTVYYIFYMLLNPFELSLTIYIVLINRLHYRSKSQLKCSTLLNTKEIFYTLLNHFELSPTIYIVLLYSDELSYCLQNQYVFY